METLYQKEVVSIAELTGRLGVSHMTVRRDIQQLETEGRVLQVSGGVKMVENILSEPSRELKILLQSREKLAIAAEAARRVSHGATVYLDAGTTCLALAVELAQRDDPADDLAVVTNDFAIAAYLMEHARCALYHTGGRVLRVNESCVGESAARFIRSVNIDVGFISASSWNTQYISTPTESKVPVKKAVVEAAAKRVLISDATKYGKVGFFNAVAMRDIHEIITDTGLQEHAREMLRREGVAVTAVSP